MSPSTLSLTRPDDWHLHLRDETALQLTVGDSARQFGRSIVMPNLKPPVSTAEAALSYRDRILNARPADSDWQPLMTLYLTDNMAPSEISRAVDSGHIYACKLYPAGATTNSDSGVTDVWKIRGVLEAMQEHQVPLLIHGEVTDSDIDIFDREAVFIERTLEPLLKEFPELKIVLEHITTAEATQFVSEGPENLAATITAHHLLFNRNHMLAGGIRPHYYCLPILKRNRHQQALIDAATSGISKFFLGTDSAPHTTHAKESDCGCAGCYTSHCAIELYATAFERAGKLDRLEAFASFHGADFYGLPRNNQQIQIDRLEWQIPASLQMGEEPLTPLLAGDTLSWKLRA